MNTSKNIMYAILLSLVSYGAAYCQDKDTISEKDLQKEIHQLARLHQHLDSLNSVKNELETKEEAKDKTSEIYIELNATKERIKAKTSQIGSLQNTIKTYFSKCHIVYDSDPETSVVELTNTNQKLNAEILDLHNENEHLKGTIGQQSREITELKSYNSKLISQHKSDSANISEFANKFILKYAYQLLKNKYSDRVEEVMEAIKALPDSVRYVDNRKKHLIDWVNFAANKDKTIKMEIERTMEILSHIPEYETRNTDVDYVDGVIRRSVAVMSNKEKQDLTDIGDAIAVISKYASESDKKNNYLCLLGAYKDANEEIKSILTEIQNDRNNNISDYQTYRNHYIQRVKNSQYYKTYYKHDWRIMYLDGIYDEVLQRLGNKDLGRVNFDDILNKL
ncbi:MAG: hypothetical protein IJK62_14120 [Bacteroidales bacterium]|nr:hypothetical protein [Bacteroidales bacterium]